MTDSLSLAGYSVDFLHVYIGIYKKNKHWHTCHEGTHVMKAHQEGTRKVGWP